jgi:F420-0:gamma-glutamyl ligase
MAAVAGAGGALLLVAAVGGGYLAGHSSRPRAEVRTVTVVRTAPPKVITQWKTKIVTVTQTGAPAAPAGVPCSMVNTGFLVVGNPGGNVSPTGTCGVALYGNNGNGSVKLSDSAGHVTWYDLGPPSSSGG